ncbi:hypothetical protein C8Q69DRAFT_468171 [Paecilomyces variotii]|uniref:Uncharacterized protein n=1 Tax=Byssochlamys spectabilis TaxID=264951 RepID=A0A443HSW6_BYSSP|nr:hypothetical protein C8Q69DRAFT_468171 [Paecilomyces variotii]RWQ94889.1 hypothetical protein C8Q69DRAFT_468171 [Paecilomyces variotii]
MNIMKETTNGEVLLMLSMAISLGSFALCCPTSLVHLGNRKRSHSRWRLQAWKIECSRPGSAPEPNRVLRPSDHQHRRQSRIARGANRCNSIGDERWRKTERWSVKISPARL